MTGNSAVWEVMKTDILVIGGGFGGLWSALRAAECGSAVTLVDRSFVGKSGHSHFASGTMMALLPEDNLDDYVYDIVLGNEWLVDQEMVAAVMCTISSRMLIIPLLAQSGLVLRIPVTTYLRQKVSSWLQTPEATQDVPFGKYRFRPGT